MEEKVSNLFEDLPEAQNTQNTSSVENKVNAIESIADIAEETELDMAQVPNKFSKLVDDINKTDIPVNKTAVGDNSKMWTLAVVGSVLILVASAVGMVLILVMG